jgi:HPt (histidine-containing phosphotransfer) domain-containing protein
LPTQIVENLKLSGNGNAALKAGPFVPRVQLVTAQVPPRLGQPAKRQSVRAFVPKPIAPAELYEQLRRLTAPSLEAIEGLFGDDPEKVAACLSQLEQELQDWDSELRALLQAPDPERLRRLHHRMKTALGQLDLWKLDRAPVAWRHAMESDAAADIPRLGSEALQHLRTLKSFAYCQKI